MRKAPRDVLRGDFIGLQMEVIKSTHSGYVGIKGIVVDETKNMLAIRHKGKLKWVPKTVCIFALTLPSGEVVMVDGKLISHRPEDRIKAI